MGLPALILMLSALFPTAVEATTFLDPRPEDSTTLFGRAIAVVGDLDADGVPDLAVGAPFQDGDFVGSPGFGKPQNVGKVWVVSGATLSVLFRLEDPHYQVERATPQFGGQLGTSVSAVADINGDGVPDILAGVPHHVDAVSGDNNTGQAFAFSGADGSVLLTLDDPTPQEGGLGGYAVAGLGDVNSDGVPDLAVGVPGKNIGDEEDGLIAVGLVYIFSGKDGSLLRTVNHPTQELNARFGSAVDNAGDIDHDGVSDVLIGAPGRSEAFVFSGATGVLIFKVNNRVAERQPSFGSTVAGGKDLDNDGIPDFAVGAPLQQHSRGAVYIFNGSDGTLQRKLHFHTPAPQTFARFGAAICLSADLTGDGRPDILVGAPDQDLAGLINAGEVFIFNGATGKPFQTRTSAVPQAFAGFGSALAAADLDGDGTPTPIIGTPYENTDIVGDDGDVETHLQIGQIEIQ